MVVEDGDDLGKGVAQPIMEPGREHQSAIAERGPGQGVGDDRLDGFLAVRAPVAVDGVLGDNRCDLLGECPR